MPGFSGATGVPLKQMQDAIAQSTANKVVQGIISNAKISDTVRSSTVPVGISVWQTQTATDSPVTGNVSMAMIIKPTASGQFSVCALFATGHVYMSNQLGASGDFVWTTL